MKRPVFQPALSLRTADVCFNFGIIQLRISLRLTGLFIWPTSYLDIQRTFRSFHQLDADNDCFPVKYPWSKKHSIVWKFLWLKKNSDHFISLRILLHAAGVVLTRDKSWKFNPYKYFCHGRYEAGVTLDIYPAWQFAVKLLNPPSRFNVISWRSR